MVQRKFRLSDMIPNAWFYKHRDMGAQGRGVVGMHRRSWSARWSREFVQQLSRNRVTSARWNWNREVDVCWHPAEVVEQPVTPTKGSSHSPLPRRASYYYSTRDREVPLLPRAKEAQSPTRSSRRRNKVGHAPEGRRHVSATVPVHGKEPVVDAPVSSCRRRDMCIQSGAAEEPGRPTMAGPPDHGINVKVIASENEIIIDLRDAYVTRPARRHPELNELDGSHVDLAVRDKDTPERRLRPIATSRPARRHPELNELDGSHVYLAGVTVRGEDTPEGRLRPIATRPVRRLGELNKREDSHVDHADVTARARSASEKSSISKPRRSLTSGRQTRVNIPRLAVTARRGKPQARNWTPPVIAVVKQSRGPRKDFRESMEEMIRAKRIRDAGELEDLLACYLSLNDAEHHDLIIEVFEQIWMNLDRAPVRC